MGQGTRTVNTEKEIMSFNYINKIRWDYKVTYGFFTDSRGVWIKWRGTIGHTGRGVVKPVLERQPVKGRVIKSKTGDMQENKWMR